MRDVEEFFAGHPIGLTVHAWCEAQLVDRPDVTQRVGRSQVAFARRRGFAYLWLPGQYLRNPRAELVLSLALPERIESPRWKEVVHPSATTWMHHLEISAPNDLDAEVAGWLQQACAAAG